MLGADFFLFDAVLLVGEGEGGVVCLCKGCNVVPGGVEDVAVAAEGDVAEAERGRFVLGAGVAVFAGPHKEVEADPDDVCNTLCSGVAGM